MQFQKPAAKPHNTEQELQVAEGGVVGCASPHDYSLGAEKTARGTYLGTQLTDRGISRFVEIVAAVRDAVGWETAIAVDHFGPVTVKDAIRLGRAMEPYALGWMEDILPWWDVEGNREVTRSINVPTLNGEDIYLLDGWKEMIERRAVDIIQPDLLTSGGMLETKRIADYAESYGLPTVLHFAGSPIAFMASKFISSCPTASRMSLPSPSSMTRTSGWQD